MVHAKNYATVSTFVKIIKLWPLFPDTVYTCTRYYAYMIKNMSISVTVT